MMERCWEKFQHYEAAGCETTFDLKDHLWTLFRYEKGLFDPRGYPDDEYVYDGCNCGNCHLTILSDGVVYACRRMESRVGNALTDDLYDLFTGPKFDRYRVYENFEKCAKCELLRDGRVQVLGYTMYKEMIRLSGKAEPVPAEEQERWKDVIFQEQPYLANVYPGDTRNIGIIFRIQDMVIEYFSLGVNPIFRESYTVGGGRIARFRRSFACARVI